MECGFTWACAPITIMADLAIRGKTRTIVVLVSSSLRCSFLRRRSGEGGDVPRGVCFAYFVECHFGFFVLPLCVCVCVCGCLSHFFFHRTSAAEHAPPVSLGAGRLLLFLWSSCPSWPLASAKAIDPRPIAQIPRRRRQGHPSPDRHAPPTLLSDSSFLFFFSFSLIGSPFSTGWSLHLPNNDLVCWAFSCSDMISRIRCTRFLRLSLTRVFFRSINGSDRFCYKH